jgi:asparagine synthase (glutamine-hydrolysing)
VKRWYDLPIPGNSAPVRIDDVKRQVLDAFDQAVADQCISDVPVGAFLSGGVDSSAIVSAMVTSGHRPARTYCIGFDGPSLQDEGFGDDLTFARDMALKFDVPLSEIRIAEPVPEEFEKLPWILDEPEADPAALFVAKIAEAARNDGIKVLLGGTGGDDVFSGYRRHRAAALRSRFGPLSRGLPIEFASRLLVGAALRRRLEKIAYMFDGSDEGFLLRSFEFNRRDMALDCLSDDIRARVNSEQSGYLEAGIDKTRGRALVDRMLYLEFLGFLPDHNLNYTDKAAMAHGVEVRVPFLDTRLIDVAARIPWRLKTRGMSEKWILRA